MMRTMYKACLIALCLTSCTTTGQSTDQNDFCDNAQAIYLHDGDKITPRTSAEILAHNRKGHDLCGWGYAK